MFRRHGFTLAEALLAMVLIGIAITIISPALKKIVPDSNAVLASKAYNILENGVKNVIEDTSYDNGAQLITDKVGVTTDTGASVQKGLANISTVGTSVPAGQNKFCYLLSKQMNCVNSDCTTNNTFKTSNGMDWKVVTPSDAFSLRADNGGYTTRVIFDVNGDNNGPNCGDGTYITACANGKTPDKYEVGVRYDGRMLNITNAHSDVLNTCGKDGVTPYTLGADYYYHQYDAIVVPPVECNKYLCTPCSQSDPSKTCGPIVVSNDGTNYYEKDPGPSTQTCYSCKLCGNGAGYCGESNTTCASNQPECTPVDNKVPSKSCPNVCNPSYVCGTSSSGTYTSFESFYYVKRDNNSSGCVHGNECSRSLCTPCSQGDPSKTCGPIVVSNDGTNYYEKDPGPSSQTCYSCKLCGTGAGYCGESNTTCASNQPECTPVDNKVPSKSCPNICNPSYVLGSSSSGTYTTLEGYYYVTRDKNPSSCANGKEVSRTPCSPCTQGNPNTTCGGINISNDGTNYYEKDPGPGNTVCYQCTMCSTGTGGCGKTASNDGVNYYEKDNKVTSKVCYQCKMCDTGSGGCGRVPSNDGTNYYEKDAKVNGTVCYQCAICGTDASGCGRTSSNDGTTYYEKDNRVTSKVCYQCTMCSDSGGGCGMNGKTCASTSPTCTPTDAKSGKTCSNVCNANYVCGTSSSGYSTTFSNFYYYTWDNNSSAQSCFGYNSTPCSTVHCTECNNCGTHNDSCPTTSPNCNVVDDYNPSHVCSTYSNPNYLSNPCANYNSNSVITYLKSMSNSTAVNYFNGSYHYLPSEGGSTSEGAFSYSIVNATPSSSDINFTYYTGSGSCDGGGFGVFTQSLASDIAQALASQSNSLDASQISAAISSAQTTTISNFNSLDGGFISSSGQVCGNNQKYEQGYKCTNTWHDGTNWAGWFDGGTTHICRGSDDHSYTVDPSVIIQYLLNGFQNYCTVNYNQVWINRCSLGTHTACYSPCDPNCYVVDNTYNSFCSSYPNPDYLGSYCCSDYCCSGSDNTAGQTYCY